MDDADELARLRQSRTHQRRKGPQKPGNQQAQKPKKRKGPQVPSGFNSGVSNDEQDALKAFLGGKSTFTSGVLRSQTQESKASQIDQTVHDTLIRKPVGAGLKFDESTQRASVPKAAVDDRWGKIDTEDLPDPSVVVEFSKTKNSSQESASSSSNQAPPSQEVIEADSNPYNFPITHEIKLSGHTKTRNKLVTRLALDRTGSRLLTGGNDFQVKFWDFAGMDKNLRSFRTVEPFENNIITGLDWNRSGSSFLATTGEPRPKIYDREGSELMMFSRGDMYVKDMRHTKGHVMGVTGGRWHPAESNTVVTWGLDSCVRLWDVSGQGKVSFGGLLNKTVYVCKPKSGRHKRMQIGSADISNDGRWVLCACSDGSLQRFDMNSNIGRSKRFSLAHEEGTVTSAVTIAPDGHTVVTRGGDHTLKIWDMRMIKRPDQKAEPLFVIDDLPNHHDFTQAIISPNQQMALTGTSSLRNSGENGKLAFIDLKRGRVAQTVAVKEASVVSVVWSPAINQILVGCGNGKTHVMYNPKSSTKGALLCAGKKPRKKDISDTVQFFRLEDIKDRPRKKRRRDEVVKTGIFRTEPERPAQAGVGMQGKKGTERFGRFLTKDIKRDTMHLQDPREAILQYAEKASADPMYLGNAYGQTQPKNQLAEKVVFSDEEYEENESFADKWRRKADQGPGGGKRRGMEKTASFD